MLKYLLTLSVVFLLASCSGKQKITETPVQLEEKVEIFEEPQEEEVVIPYEAVESEEEAIQLNAAEEQKVEEIEVQDRIFFDYDSFTLNEESKKILNTQVSWLKSDINIKVTTEGHADERGTREYNIALGAKRAKSVKDYLVANGVEASRIKTISYGKERPAFFGATTEIFAKNRRTVTVIN